MKRVKTFLIDDELYLGDNGRCFCGKHAGYSAKTTGRDISGQKVLRIDVKTAAAENIRCETCHPFTNK